MKVSDSRGEREWDSTWKVALKILRYLNQNPNAADTVEGILEWWLPQQSISEEERVIERALELLVERNLILAIPSSYARKHYRLNAECIDECRKLISDVDARVVDEMNSFEEKE